MAKVRALVKCYVDNGLREVDDVFEYNGPKNGCLEILEGEVQDADEPEEKAPVKRWTKKAAKTEE